MNSSQPAALESGASTSMFQHPAEAIKGTYQNEFAVSAELAAGSLPSKCLGTGMLSIAGINLNKSVYVEQLNGTLISLGHICNQDKTILFTKNESIILNLTEFIKSLEGIAGKITRDKITRLYEGRKIILRKNTALTVKQPDDVNLSLRLLVHTSATQLKYLQKHATSFPKIKINLQPCHPCLLGKALRKIFDFNFKCVYFPGEILHSDLSGKLPSSLNGNRYYWEFMILYSR